MLFVDTSIIHYSSEGVLILCNILDLLIYRYEELVSEVTGQYKSMFPPRGGLSEFYIWDNSFEVRYRANHEYEQIKLQIEAILSKCK